MTDFSKIINKAKEMEIKMRESQEKIKSITATGVSGSNSVRVTINGEWEMVKLEISDETLKEEKMIIEDLIVAALAVLPPFFKLLFSFKSLLTLSSISSAGAFNSF